MKPPIRWVRSAIRPGGVVAGREEKTWLRGDAGGNVEGRFDRDSLVREDETVHRITCSFHTESEETTAPSTDLLVRALDTAVVDVGEQICHLVGVGDDARRSSNWNAGFRTFGRRIPLRWRPLIAPAYGFILTGNVR